MGGMWSSLYSTRSYVKVIKRYSLQLKRLFIARFWKLKQVLLPRNNDSFEMNVKISPKINKVFRQEDMDGKQPYKLQLSTSGIAGYGTRKHSQNSLANLGPQEDQLLNPNPQQDHGN